MKNAAAAFLVGIIFSIGLGLSGMTQPQKISAFLDFFGNWDPSLLFVMGGAVCFHFVTYKIIRRRASPLLDTKWYVPEIKEINGSLLLGSAIFGIGWGLGGYCPGPAITSLADGSSQAFIFVLAMISGMTLFSIVKRN